MIPVRVAIRVRPLLDHELQQGCLDNVCADEKENTIEIGPKVFTYDYVFAGSDRANELYESCVQPLLDGCFQGLNATVLAYGQTGSGKTFTMGTTGGSQGVIPRVAKDIFANIEEEMKEGKIKYSVTVSFLEIYREEIRDLLCSTSSLSVREDTNGQVFVSGLSETKVLSECDILDTLDKGCSERATGATSMNATSSRSHAIFTINVRAVDEETQDVRVSKFHLVDLAGSERAKRTHAQGKRLQEGIDINKGLLCLGNVISALGSETKRQGHIPYRDSKLTRLLQDSLGGNSRTLMIACASPADSNFEETLNTLKYANRARNIQNKPTTNREDNTHAQNKIITQLRAKISALEAELYDARDQTNPTKTRETCAVLMKLSERNAYLEDMVAKIKISVEEQKNSPQFQDQLNAIFETPQETSSKDDETKETDDENFNEREQEHMENQVALQRELQKITEELDMKVKAADQMNESNEGFDSMRKAYEATMEKMCSEVIYYKKNVMIY